MPLDNQPFVTLDAPPVPTEPAAPPAQSSPFVTLDAPPVPVEPAAAAQAASQFVTLDAPPVPPGPAAPPSPAETVAPTPVDPMGFQQFPDPNAPAKPGEGFFPGVISGFEEDLRNKARIARGEAFVADPNAPPPIERSFANELGFGLGSSGGMVAGGVGGAALGTSVTGGNPIGGLVGAALGVSGAVVLQDMVPAYDQAIRNGKTHDEAVNYAIVHASATGVISGLTAPLFALAPFKSALGKILFQAFATQPVAGGAVRVGVPAVMGEPLPTTGEMVRGGAMDVATGAAFAGPHTVYQAGRPPPPVPVSPEVDRAVRGSLAPVGAPSATDRVEPAMPAPVEPGSTFTAPLGTPTPTELPTLSTQPTAVLGPQQEPLVVNAQPAPRAPEPRPLSSEPAAPSEPPTVAAPTPVGIREPAPLPTETTQGTRPTVPGAEVPRAEPSVVQPSTISSEPGRAPPDDGLNAAAGGPAPAVSVGAENAPRVEPPGVPGAARAGGDIAGRPPDTQGAPAGEPVAPAPAQAKRPVTQNELEALDKRFNLASQALARARHDPNVTPERFDTLRQRYEEAKAARDNAEGPPRRASYHQPGQGGPTVAEITAQHEAATAAHTAAIGERIHAEGQAPVPDTRTPAIGRVFNMAGGSTGIVRATDTAGNTWTGNGNVLLRGHAGMERAANAESKKARSTERMTGIQPAALDRVVVPDPKATYGAVTWERQVTDAGGMTIVIGTKPDGTFIAVQKPVYDALHAAAGPDGDIRVGTSKGDDRVFAHNAQGEAVGVGMPRTIDQAQAKIYVRGREQPAEPIAPLEDRAPTRGEPTSSRVRLQSAVRVGGEIYTGATHGEAYDAALREHGGVDPGSTAADRNLFVAPDGAVLSAAEASALRAREEAGTTGTSEIAGQLSPEMQRVMAENIAKAEQSREGGVEVVRDQIQYLAKGGASEREADAVIRRAIEAEIERGGDAESFLDEAGVTSEARARFSDVVPGTSEEAGTTGPGAEVSGTRQLPGGERQLPGEVQSPQLEKLITTRDQLQNRVQSPADQRKLTRINAQIERLQRSQGTTEDRRGGRKEPFKGPPQTIEPKDFLDYKFNDGTSVWRSVFEQAGHDPDIATNMKIEDQNEILRQHMKNVFGFRDVRVSEKGTAVDDYQARNAMLDMTRAVQDLMSSLGLPHEAASLNGRLSLVYEPTGPKKPFGSYAPGSGEIMISGRSNSFGHEWTHAVDHLLAEGMPKTSSGLHNLMTRYAQGGMLNPQDRVQGAFAHVLNALFYDKAAQALREIDLINRSNRVDRLGAPTKDALAAKEQLAQLERAQLNLRIQPTEFRARARSGPNAGYFADPVELLARAHEAYLARLMQNDGKDPRGAVMPDEAYIDETIRQLKLYYPKEQDRINIFRAFDDWHAEMAKADILSEGKPAGGAFNLGISDPAHYTATAPGQANTPQAQRNRAAVNSWRNRITAIINAQKALLYDPNRPASPPGQGQFQRHLDAWKSVVMTYRSILKLIGERAPPAAQAAAREVLDRFATAPRSGRPIPETLGEAAQRQRDTWTRFFVNALKDGGFSPRDLEHMSPEDDAMVRHVMVTGETRYPPDPNNPSVTVPIPANFIKVGGKLRQLMDVMFDRSNAVGLDIGYSDRYFPRLYDHAKIFSDEPGFLKQATAVYRIAFDNEVGTPGSDPQALLEKWTTLSRQDRDLAATNGNADLAGRMNELSKNLRQQRAIEENPNPTPAERAQLAQLKIDARQMAADAHPLLQDHVSSLSANDWYARLAEPSIFNFDTTHATGRYLNARALPPEADVLMRDYMHTGIGTAIPHYIDAVARRTADAERFGVHGEDLQRLITAMREGGMHPDDLQWFVNTVADLRGSDKPRNSKTQQLVTSVHALASVYLMARSMWSGLAEPMNTYAVTGRGRDGIMTFVNQIGGLLRTASARERTEWAELLGVTENARQSTIAMSRMGTDYADSPLINKWMSRFYRTSGLTGTVNSQRAHGAAQMHWFLEKVAQDFQNKGTGTIARLDQADAVRWLNDLGVPPAYHQEFTDWLTSLNGRPSAALLLKDPMAGAYGLAIRRLVNRANQAPQKVDRAAGSSTSRWAWVFQLQSFNYSMWHNVMEPVISDIEHSYGRAKLAATQAGYGPTAARVQGVANMGGTVAHTGAIVGAILGAAIPPMLLKLYLFDRDRFDKLIDSGDISEVISQAWSRAGLNAQFDPIIQAFSHSKYDADVSSMIEGAGPNFLAKNILQVIQPFIMDADAHTNTRQFRAWQGAYNLFGIPLSAVAMTGLNNMLGSVPYIGPAARIATGYGLQKLTSPGVTADVAEAAVGPKGVKDPAYDTSGGAGLPGLPKMGGLPSLPKLGAQGAGGETAAESSGMNGWGLIDDVLIPAWRKAGPLLNLVPAPVKIGAAVTAGGYGLYKALEAGAPFRGQPAPEKAASP